ncbi:MAG TPA: alpha/beta hydrolase [Solirubrobacterales bacterium]|nr:alpha/beta hydrolase [Solirubrobacterales bacterium]
MSTRSRDAPDTTLVGQLIEEYFPFAPPRGQLPDATPAEGPDPYGNPDPEWLRVDWRDHLHQVTLDGARVNYVELGSGPRLPLVFVHGLSGSWQNWLENIPHFAREHRVLALDLPGFGHSPLPDWEISIEGYGRLLHNFCDALEVRGCAVVGNSMGGFISADAASAEPGRFEKLVLVSAAGISHARLHRQPAETLARMATAAAPLLLRLQERGMRRPRVRWATFKGLFQHPEELRREVLQEQFENGAGRPGFLPAVHGLVGYDILDQLAEVEVPTLIVWGRNDRVVPPQDALGFSKRLRNSQTVIFDDTGHLPQLERPTRFNRVLETFLAD